MEFMTFLLPAFQVDGDDFMILYRIRTVVSSWTTVLVASSSFELPGVGRFLFAVSDTELF